METDFNIQFKKIKKILKESDSPESEINSILNNIQKNYNSSKKFIHKKFLFRGINNIGLVIGVNCFSSYIQEDSFNVDEDTQLITILDKDNSEHYFYSSDIIKEI